MRDSNGRTGGLPGHRCRVRGIALACVVASLFALAVSAPAAVAQPAPPLRDHYRKIEYRIPMRDGIRLYTSVYVPRSMPGKHPILMRRTAYGAGPYGPDAYITDAPGSRKFMDAGYIFVWQDVRGRGESEGTFVNVRPRLVHSVKPHDFDESTDAWDTIDFLVKHVPDNNGRVGVWGISYTGFYAGAAAINSHPALKVVSPQAPVSDWFLGDDCRHNGALFLMDAAHFGRFGDPVEPAYPAPNMDTQGDPVGFFLKHGTLAELTREYFPRPDGFWQFMMNHGTYDECWQARSLPPSMVNVRCALLVVGGWFDAEDCWGAVNTARTAARQNPGTRTSLVMGPWSHGRWSQPGGERFGDMEFGQPTTTYYREQIEFPFIDAYLRGSGRPGIQAAKVFETGTNRWRAFRQWPPREARSVSFTLRDGRRLGIGAQEAAVGTECDTYVSDPAHPVPYQGGVITGRTSEYMVDDQRFACSRDDVLSYQSDVLQKSVTIAGPLTAELFISTTGSDADFVVKVIDVYPDTAPGKLAGYQNLLRGDIMRARFRDSFQNPAAIKPGQVTRVAFEMPDLLHTFLPGHRIMVQVQSSWFPLVDRNPQKFVDIARARAEDFQKATIRVYHSAMYPSQVHVGVLAGKTP